MFLVLIWVCNPFAILQRPSWCCVFRVLYLDLGAADPPLQLALPSRIQIPGVIPETIFWVSTPNSTPVLGLRQITDCVALIGLGYKHPQTIVYFYSFKLYLGLQ